MQKEEQASAIPIAEASETKEKPIWETTPLIAEALKQMGWLVARHIECHLSRFVLKVSHPILQKGIPYD